jgi:hypothetical protein
MQETPANTMVILLTSLKSSYKLSHCYHTGCTEKQTIKCVLCVTFWVVVRRMVSNSRHFGTLCLFHLHRQVDALAYEDGTDIVFRNIGY